MSYSIVQNATMGQAYCVISGTIDGPFIDTGTVCRTVEPYGYINVAVFKDIATKTLHMVDEETHSDVRGQVAELRARVRELEGELEGAAQVVAAIDAIESAGFRARKKKGPKPKEVAV